ncbi:MAG TPA: response regulator transcription factor [Deltaproteobacteria bacterium]|nr:response regulator transcription factor [Deltaproteobacteria bacterium]
MMIAVIDDEPDILSLVSLHLKRSSFSVETFPDAHSFLAFLQRKTPDLIILDLMLPDENGFEVCRRLKSDANLSSIPIIMLTAKTQEEDTVTGLEIGADDYMTKPFSPRELVARVKALLRRTAPSAQGTITLRNGLVIDPESFQVRLNENTIELTLVEFRILHLLASKQNKVFTREVILDHLWGNEKAVLDRTVDVHIKNVRDKLGPAGDCIKNVRGVGYKVEG